MGQRKRGKSPTGTLAEINHTDFYLPTGRIGSRDLSAGCYSFAEVLTLVSDELLNQGKDKKVLKELRESKMTVREYLHMEFGIVTGPREASHSPHITADEADLKSLEFAVETAHWLARRRLAKERSLRRNKIIQAWKAKPPTRII